jgi:drug/metabolite transporter (DMT)-like permease
MLLLLGSLWLFKESFNRWQGLGLISFVSGLVLFFNHRLADLMNLDSEYGFGVLLVFIAAIFWAIYALAQKQLLKQLTSVQIMMIIFSFGSLVFLPNSEPTQLLNLDSLGWFLLIFCGANTVVAYGAFSESLAHWEASRVSAVLAITPLFTLFFMHLTSYYFPDYIQTENLNQLSLVGAFLVVVGSAGVALIKSKKS